MKNLPNPNPNPNPNPRGVAGHSSGHSAGCVFRGPGPSHGAVALRVHCSARAALGTRRQRSAQRSGGCSGARGAGMHSHNPYCITLACSGARGAGVLR